MRNFPDPSDTISFHYDSDVREYDFVMDEDKVTKAGMADGEYYKLKYPLEISQSGGALSIIASYEFEFMMVGLALKDKETN